MDILLVNPPWKFKSSRPPLGLPYIAAVLEDAGYQPRILDMGIENSPWGKLEEALGESPKFIGVTMNTSTFSEGLEVLRFVKKACPKAMTIVGGPHPTALPEETASMKEVDAVVRGEGEYTFLEILETVKKREDLKKVRGITIKVKGKAHSTPERPLIMELDKLPFPSRHLIKFERYEYRLKGRKAASMVCSRGCPYNCLYCLKALFGRKYRIRSVENVIKEIEKIKREYGVTAIMFNDDIFTLDKEWIKEFCEEVIRRDLGIIWRCETRVDNVSPEILKLMKVAGCYDISYGIESGNQRILDIIRKGIKLDQVRKAMKWTKEAGIHTTAYFMIGLPEETRKSAMDTIRFASEIDPDEVRFSMTTPYPGTDLYRLALEKGLIESRDWSRYYAVGPMASTDPVMQNENLSKDELKKLFRRAYMTFTISKMLKFNMSSLGWMKFVLRGIILGL